ncbi:MAG TPA: hypothetical protein VF170_20070, partial [Planctomycetaceae bacterium]
ASDVSVRKALGVTGGTLLFTGVVWLAGTGPEPPERPLPKGYVERLASPDPRERAEAEEELRALGPSAVNALPPDAIAGIADPAAREAVEAVRDRLLLRNLEAEPDGRRVTLAWDGPLSGAVQSLNGTPAEESHFPHAVPHANATDATDEASPRVEVRAVHEPYWSVVDEIARQAGMVPTIGRGQARSGIRFRERTPADEARRVVHHRAFRIAAGPVEPETDPERGRPACRVPLTVMAEPSVRLLSVSYAGGDLRLVAGDGTELPPLDPEARHVPPAEPQVPVVELRPAFLTPAEPVAGPLSIRGTLTAAVAVGPRSFMFPLRAGEAREHAEDGVSVRLGDVTPNPDGISEVELTVTYGTAARKYDPRPDWATAGTAYIRHLVEGNPEYRPEPGVTTEAVDGGAVVRYRFRNLPGDLTYQVLHYETWALFVETPVEFAIDGLTAADGALSAGSGGGR